MTNLDTSVIQVTNVSPTSTLEQMTSFFGYVGIIQDIVIYPKDDQTSIQTQSKTCYVRFKDLNSVKVAQHLSNTVFIDRALIVTPVFEDRIPDESTAFSLTSGLNTSNNEGLINQVVTGNNGTQVISTMDPRLSALGLAQYPVLPSNTDPSRIEEIRRTIQVSNLDANVTGEDVLRFFNQIGEVKYVRLNSNDNIPANLTKLKVALVEFTEQSSVASALQSNGSIIGTLPIKVSHSTQAIIKPLSSRNSITQQKDIEDTMRRVRDSQLIEQPGIIKLENILHLTNEHNKIINATAAGPDRDRRSSRSRSRSKRSRSKESRRRYDEKYSRSSRDRDYSRRSKSRERYDDKYSRSRDRSRDRYSSRRSSRSPRRSRRSRSRERRRDDSRDRRRERSRSSDRYKRDRSKDRYRRKESPSKLSSSRRRRGEKTSRDDGGGLAMDQDLTNVKESRGPSTPEREPKRRSKDDSKHSKEKKRRKHSDAESDDNSVSMGDQEMIEN